MRSILSRISASAAVLALASIGATEIAQANIITNGNFTSPSVSTSEALTNNPEFSPSKEISLTSWTAAGYSFVFTSPTATANSSVSLYQVTAPPGGENFVAIDPSYKGPGSISQTVNGLTKGDTYVLSFEYAGAQQSGYKGATTEQWDVSLGGGATQDTPVINLPNDSPNSAPFSGWQTETFKFVANGSSEVLEFLAAGGPAGTEPPFDLLADVSLTQQTRTPVPEPVSLSLFGAGLVGAAAIRRRKKNKKI